MGFLNPLLLLGILAAAAPVLIHLWSRRRARTLEFSALRFILAAAQQSARRFRLEQLLLLALRVLALALIALAMSRPILRGAALFGNPRVQTTAVIVLDQSASMGYEGVDGVPFEKAKARALEILRSLQPGDSVSVILMSDRQTTLFEPPTTQIDEAERAIESAQLRLRGTRPESALERAAELVERSQSPNREIYVLSDFTANGWNGARVPVESARVFMMPFRAVSEGPVENVYAASIQPDNPIVAAGTPTVFRVELRNTGAATAQRRLEFRAGGKLKSAAAVTIPPESSVVKEFQHAFEAAGRYEARASIDQDRLAGDDERAVVVDALGQIDAYIVGGNALHIALALNPSLEPQPESVYAVRPVLISNEEAGSRSFDAADLLILQDPPLNDERLNSRLRNRLLSGQPVLVFLGERADSTAAPDWLPVSVGPVQQSQEPLKLRPAHLSNPSAVDSQRLFGIFEGDPWMRQGAPSFYRYRQLTVKPAAQTLCSFSNGETAAAVGRALGGVCVVVNASGYGRESSNFPLNPSFPPLVQQLAFYALTPQNPPPRSIEAGTPFRLPLKPSDPAAFEIEAPDGEKRSVGRTPDGAEMSYRWTDEAGLYRVSGGGGFSEMFVVNAPVDESNLAPLPREQALNAVQGSAAWVDSEETPETASWDLQQERLGRELWAEALLLAALLLAAESFLSNRPLKE